MISPRLTLGGFLARFAIALLVAGATYNPSRYSYFAWAKSTGFGWRPPTVFVGVVLLIGWASISGRERSSACKHDVHPLRRLPPARTAPATGCSRNRRGSRRELLLAFLKGRAS